MAKTVKMFNGVRVETEKGVKNYKDMTFFKAYTFNGVDETDIMRALIMNYPNYIILDGIDPKHPIFRFRLLGVNEDAPWETCIEEE